MRKIAYRDFLRAGSRSGSRAGALRLGAAAAAVSSALLAGGCSGMDHGSATHRWVAMDQVSGVEYRVDNNQCARETLGETGPRVLETGTEAYDQYVSCMNEKGYVLTAYSDEK